ncbi:MAG: hypothetical protein M3P04_10940 [Actinomycetota bacterium]|nr:hypothetical protein [Actinomycetota bacterium]
MFHWPVYLWLTAERTGLSEWPLFALRVSVTLLIAVVSYALIEEPVRLAKRLQVSIALPAWAASTTLALASLVLASGAVTPTPDHALSASGSHESMASVPPLPTIHRKPSPTASRPAAVRSSQGPTKAPATSPPAAASSSAAPRAVSVDSSPRPSLGPPPTKRQTRDSLRVAVVGDSLSMNLGAGLVDWSDSLSNVGVDSLGMSGCSLARGGMRRWPDGYERAWNPECEWWADPDDPRMKQLTAFDPQVIVIQDGMSELVERKLDEWATYRRAGDPTFDSWMLGEYRLALEALNPNGDRKVILLNAVCADWQRVSHFQGFGPELSSRITALNLDYNQLQSEARVTVDDLKEHLCPGGRYSDTVDGVSDGRPDGYHLSRAAALAVAKNWLGPICLDANKQ